MIDLDEVHGEVENIKAAFILAVNRRLDKQKLTYEDLARKLEKPLKWVKDCLLWGKHLTLKTMAKFLIVLDTAIEINFKVF